MQRCNIFVNECKDQDDKLCIPHHDNVFTNLKVYDADTNTCNFESIDKEKSEIGKNMQIHAVDSKLNHNIHGSVGKENVTNA